MGHSQYFKNHSIKQNVQFSSTQSLSRVQLLRPHGLQQASLSITSSSPLLSALKLGECWPWPWPHQLLLNLYLKLWWLFFRAFLSTQHVAWLRLKTEQFSCEIWFTSLKICMPGQHQRKNQTLKTIQAGRPGNKTDRHHRDKKMALVSLNCR